MDQITVRPAVREDLPFLYQFEQGIVAAERPFDPTLKEGVIHYYDLAAMIGTDDAVIAVAECNGQLVGAGSARKLPALPFLKHAFHAHLGFMFVDPAFRGRGVIQLVMESLKNWAVEKELNIIRLEVYAENASAIRAYEKMGFAPNLVEMTIDVADLIARKALIPVSTED